MDIRSELEDSAGFNSLVALPWIDETDVAVGYASKFGMRSVQPFDHERIF